MHKVPAMLAVPDLVVHADLPPLYPQPARLNSPLIVFPGALRELLPRGEGMHPEAAVRLFFSLPYISSVMANWQSSSTRGGGRVRVMGTRAHPREEIYQGQSPPPLLDVRDEVKEVRLYLRR